MFDEASENELLLAALMQLGAKGGSIGAAAGGAATGTHGLGRAGARGGARGAARGFRWTKKDVSTTLVELSGTVTAVFQLVQHDSRPSIGNPLGVEARDNGDIAVRAMVGVGIGGLNPTVVTAVVAAGPEGVAVVELRAAGREGLIDEHPAEKALAKITAQLKAASQ